MARMIPPEIREPIKSRAEAKIFNLCKQDLGPEFTVLHSVGLSGRIGKPWSEIDFVIIGPPGVFCIEVKGGRISRKDGYWHFTDGADNTTTKREGPFDQAAGCAAELYKFLKNQDQSLWNVAVGSGVAMPDCRFDIQGPDIEHKILFDERNLNQSFSVFMRRLTDHWHAFLEKHGKRPLSLDAGTVNRIKDLIRSDFDLRPSIKTRIGIVKDELNRLTEEQYKVLDNLADNPRVLVQGGAGTGKTLLAVEEARRRGLQGERVLLCCLGEQLAKSLRTVVSDIEQVSVVDLKGFMRETVQEAGMTGDLPSAQEEYLYRTFYPEVCLDALVRLERLESFDVIILDEGQDLMLASYLELFDALLKGGLKEGDWKVFFDGSQNIHAGVNADGFKKLLEGHPARYSLTVNCRNSLPIATATEMMSGIPVAKALRDEGPEVNVVYYNDENHLRKLLGNSMNRLLGDKLEPYRICVLSPKAFLESALADSLSNVPFKLNTDPSASLPNSKMIRYSTIKAFKGLEADAVMLVEVEDLASPQSSFDLYVAGTRACAYLEIYIKSSAREQYEQRCREYAARYVENGKL